MAGQPAAAKDNRVVAVDTHIVMVPSPSGVTPLPLPHSFSGVLDGGLVSTVTIGGQAAAVVGSTASNTPAHVPTPPGASFQRPPSDKATVQVGSATVTIGGKAAARNGDVAITCNDPADLPAGTVLAAGTVMVG
ncbi:PAAR domain-containing protein [Frankia sp. QA3]|uniref:PAAR domain-containing protein n=1 Tax=Frankia sp. QA3 TaxID=710111 RepID=UPI000269BEF6|nr:PAAR domain-containing protein [Frankia sp. QA3]EIV92706.1 PAAR motif protein [Frankia sp. QA3]